MSGTFTRITFSIQHFNSPNYSPHVFNNFLGVIGLFSQYIFPQMIKFLTLITCLLYHLDNMSGLKQMPGFQSEAVHVSSQALKHVFEV